jgi:hypothetical protein
MFFATGVSMSDVIQKRRTGRKVAIDLEMAHFKKVRNFQMKSTAELFAGTRSGIEKHEKYFD